MTLTEFLMARIAEDEETARDEGAAAMMGHRWKHYPEDAYYAIQSATLANARRLSRECEAKRRIVEDFRLLHADYQVTHDPITEARRFQARVAMAHLAAVYAGHQDYREEWRP